jgi:hypothetical protein
LMGILCWINAAVAAAANWQVLPGHWKARTTAALMLVVRGPLGWRFFTVLWDGPDRERRGCGTHIYEIPCPISFGI